MAMSAYASCSNTLFMLDKHSVRHRREYVVAFISRPSGRTEEHIRGWRLCVRCVAYFEIALR